MDESPASRRSRTGVRSNGRQRTWVVRTTSGTADSSRSAFALAALMLAAGLTHFAAPRAYQRIVPRMVGDPAFWVRWSGVAELVCAGLLVGPRTRRAGALATVGILVAVFPANVKMALDGGIPGRPFPLGSPAAAWARLPLQLPLVVWAWRLATTGRAAALRARPGRTSFPGRRCTPRLPRTAGARDRWPCRPRP